MTIGHPLFKKTYTYLGIENMKGMRQVICDPSLKSDYKTESKTRSCPFGLRKSPSSFTAIHVVIEYPSL